MNRMRLSRQDIDLLLFAWKWKVVTTNMVALRIYPDLTVPGVYTRLNRLRNAGFVRTITDETGNLVVWGLSIKGFRSIRDQLPTLREEGYRSENIRHDILSAAIHLGDWIASRPSGLKTFSEQQLRRYEMNQYPDGIPRSEAHRSDGYWLLRRGSEISAHALEVELSRKPPSKYVATAKFYERANVSRVHWFVRGGATASGLVNCLHKASTGANHRHNIFLVEDFLAKGWMADAKSGPDCGKSLHETLETKAEPKRNYSSSLVLLDMRIRPINAAGYASAEKTKFCF